MEWLEDNRKNTPLIWNISSQGRTEDQGDFEKNHRRTYSTRMTNISGAGKIDVTNAYISPREASCGWTPTPADYWSENDQRRRKIIENSKEWEKQEIMQIIHLYAGYVWAFKTDRNSGPH